MAIYHLAAKVISREKGQSTVTCAAYRTAGKIHNERLGKVFDFSRKRGVEESTL
jgi:hypothetical protein